MPALGFVPHGRKSTLTEEPPSKEPKHDYGLQTIVGKDPLTAGVTDIVAIHGLNGHYEKSWTDELSQYNWLRDRLSGLNRLTMLRVMSFAYNSKVQFSKSTGGIEEFAAQLLECLLVERRSEIEQSRPLVFICHSLGGIIFKQAFNVAKSESRYEHLAKKIIGVLFFGTPHKGSNIASFTGLLSNLLKASSLGKHTNTQLLKDLERQSEVLDQISNTFLQLGGSIRIVSFYELQKMPLMSSLIVDKNSAIMDMKGETVVSLNRDHRNLCKFSSSSDKMLEVVMNNLMVMISTKQRLERQNDRDLLLRGLATSNPDVHRDRNPPPVPGTCSWILTHEKFTHWLTSTTPGLLWLSADPGCGKSVLTAFLIDYFQSQFAHRRDINICYFFFKNDNVEQHEGIFGAQAILYQILQLQPKLLDTAEKTLSQNNVGDLHKVWNTILAVSQDPMANETICILDGFDECEASSRRAVTEKLSTTFSPKNRARKRINKLRVLISSRPDNALKVAFDRPSSEEKGLHSATAYSTIRLRGEDETDAICRDISLVIDNELSEIQDMGLPIELLDEVRKELVARADRTFLWVTLIIQLLRERAVAGASRRELREIMQSRDIDSIYAGLLAGRPYNLRARKLLSVVIAAKRPLSVGELSIALVVEPEVDCLKPDGRARPGDYSFIDVEDNLVYPFENHIVALCGNFIRIIRNKVYLVHETAREFLLSDFPKEICSRDEVVFLDDDEITMQNDKVTTTEEDISPSWKSSLTLTQCHAICLGVCVTYIYCMGKKTLGYTLGEPSPRTAPFLDYAASQWTTHFSQIRDSIDQRHLSYYHNICHPRFPGFKTWLEAHSEDPAENHLLNLRGADDDIQDELVSIFKLESEDGDHIVPRGTSQTLRHFSTNPGTLMNHHFPISVSSSGWVSLDLNMPEYSDVTKNPW